MSLIIGPTLGPSYNNLLGIKAGISYKNMVYATPIFVVYKIKKDINKR